MKRDELYLGVDLGGVNVRAGVIDSSGHILGQEKHRLLSKEPPQVAEAVLRAAKTACGAAGMPFSEMKGMGLGVAGMIDRGQGLVRSAPALGWRDVPFLRLLQARTPRTPLWIASELSVSAWGELAVGAGRGANDLIVVLVGATVGAGIVMAGKLH
jgi:glucokinase